MKVGKRNQKLERQYFKLIGMQAMVIVVLAAMLLGFAANPSETKRKCEVQNPVKLTVVETGYEEPRNPVYNVPLDRTLCLYTEQLCREMEVPVEIIYSMMYTESRFNTNAVGAIGEIGLMQLNKNFEEYFEEQYGVSNIRNPKENILCGVSMMSEYLEKYSLEESLMVYNCGLSMAQKLWDKGVYSTDYTQKVLLKADEFAEK